MLSCGVSKLIFEATSELKYHLSGNNTKPMLIMCVDRDLLACGVRVQCTELSRAKKYYLLIKFNLQVAMQWSGWLFIEYMCGIIPPDAPAAAV